MYISNCRSISTYRVPVKGDTTHPFSPTPLTVKDKFEFGATALAGGAFGAVPGLGVFTNIAACFESGLELNSVEGLLGLAGAFANLAACVGLASGAAPAYVFAVPGILGAMSWGGTVHKNLTAQRS